MNSLIQEQVLQAIVTNHNHDLLFCIVALIMVSMVSFLIIGALLESVGSGVFCAVIIFFFLSKCIATDYGDFLDLEDLKRGVTLVPVSSQQITQVNLDKNRYKINGDGNIIYSTGVLNRKYRYIIPFGKEPLSPTEVSSLVNNTKEDDITSTIVNYDIQLNKELTETLSKGVKRVLYNIGEKYKLVIAINGNYLYTAEELGFDPVSLQSISQQEVVSEDEEYHVKPLKSGKVYFTNNLTDQILSENWNKDYNFILTDGDVETIHLSDGIKLFTSKENYILYENGKPMEIHFNLNNPNQVNVNVTNDITVSPTE